MFLPLLYGYYVNNLTLLILFTVCFLHFWTLFIFLMYIFVLPPLCFLMLKICYIPVFVGLFIFLCFCWTLFSFLLVFYYFLNKITISYSYEPSHRLRNLSKVVQILLKVVWFSSFCVEFSSFFVWFFVVFCRIFLVFCFSVFWFFEHCSVFYGFLLFLLNIVHFVVGFTVVMVVFQLYIFSLANILFQLYYIVSSPKYIVTPN